MDFIQHFLHNYTSKKKKDIWIDVSQATKFLSKVWIQLGLIWAEKLYNFLFVDAP